jgi:hypothetical protein
MPFRAVFFLCALCACIDAQVAPGSFLLSDNFTEDTSLNQDLWRVNSPLVGAVAEGLQLVTPQLAFSNMGMTVTGVSAIRQIAGIQSAQAFTPPFTVRATVKGIVAHANPFVLYLVTAGNSQSLRITGNLNPGNAPAYKTAVALKGQPARTLDSYPSVNKWYMLTIAVGPRGNATVTEVDQAGNVIGTVGQLAFGMTPAFVLLAQSEPILAPLALMRPSGARSLSLAATPPKTLPRRSKPARQHLSNRRQRDLHRPIPLPAARKGKLRMPCQSKRSLTRRQLLSGTP